jgi:hypothetical protein
LRAAARAQSDPAKPIARTPSVRRNHEDLDVFAGQAIKNVVRKPGNPKSPNAGSEFDTIPLGAFADFAHGRLKGGEVACPEPFALLLIVGHVLQVFDPRCLIEEIAHFSKACA